jgi:hypothetical protein
MFMSKYPTRIGGMIAFVDDQDMMGIVSDLIILE